jgi:hypothetical protein
MRERYVRFDETHPPVTGVRAFERIAEDTVQQQAAVMLLLGQQLRGDPQAFRGRARATRTHGRVELLPRRDRAAFPVPPVTPATARLDVAATRDGLKRRYGRAPRAMSAARFEDAFHDVARRLFRRPSSERAAELLEMALDHPIELGRVSAASAYFALASRPESALGILVAHLRSRTPLVRAVAATTLARIAPDHPALQRLLQMRHRRGRRRPSHTCTIVHGTFAATSAWWQPGGDFHTYLASGPRPDVYGGSDRFGWSGGYSDGARALGAVDLLTWVGTHGLQGLDLFGHSHGGSVMMLATHGGLQAGKLILLSCPVHPSKYYPNFAAVQRVISIRVRLDLVILADGGGQRFNDPRIEEHVLPIWFDHFATHEPAVWNHHQLPLRI